MVSRGVRRGVRVLRVLVPFPVLVLVPALVVPLRVVLLALVGAVGDVAGVAVVARIIAVLLVQGLDLRALLLLRILLLLKREKKREHIERSDSFCIHQTPVEVTVCAEATLGIMPLHCGCCC